MQSKIKQEWVLLLKNNNYFDLTHTVAISGRENIICLCTNEPFK